MYNRNQFAWEGANPPSLGRERRLWALKPHWSSLIFVPEFCAWLGPPSWKTFCIPWWALWTQLWWGVWEQPLWPQWDWATKSTTWASPSFQPWPRAAQLWWLGISVPRSLSGLAMWPGSHWFSAFLSPAPLCSSFFSRRGACWVFCLGALKGWFWILPQPMCALWPQP